MNPTQELYARTLGRERMDMIEHHMRRRCTYEPVFKARVHGTTQALVGSFPRGLVRASEELIATVLHMDDVMSGRWQADQRETDPLAQIASGVALRTLGAEVRLDSVSLIHHPAENGCIELSNAHPTCPRCGAGYVQVKPS